jgi:hypothetical protein
MKLLTFGASLLFAVSLMAQQGPPYSPPPYITPPTLPGERPPELMPLPPDTAAPSPETLPSSDIQGQIQKKLTSEPLLANSSVDAAVDDSSVTLSGTVENEPQHDLALRIADSYAGERRIIDKIQVRARA